MSKNRGKNRIFLKSSFSPLATRTARCVGVSISDNDVLVKRIDNDGPTVRFSRDEWDAFIKGVKNHEFDLT